MSFTAKDVKDVARIYMRKELTDNEVKTILNNGIDQIGGKGLAHGKAEIEADKDEWHALPEDVIGPLYVTDENDNLYNNWQYLDGKIKFADKGKYEVVARRMPKQIESVDEEVDLDRLYKPALVAYLGGFSKLTDDDHSPDGARLMQDFERMAAQAFNSLIDSRRPTQVRVFRHG